MFDTATFTAYWLGPDLPNLSLHTMKLKKSARKIEGPSINTQYCDGLRLGDITAHLTITADGSGKFSYFHLTLDQAMTGKVGNKHNIRCDHVFFEIVDGSGDIRVTTSLCNDDGTRGTAKDKKGLTHNQSFLVEKVKDDCERIMCHFSSIHMPGFWQAVA